MRESRVSGLSDVYLSRFDAYTTMNNTTVALCLILATCPRFTLTKMGYKHVGLSGIGEKDLEKV